MCAGFRCQWCPVEDHLDYRRPGIRAPDKSTRLEQQPAQSNERRLMMPLPPMIEAVLQTHYRLLRTPLAVFEQHLPHHPAQGSAVHSVCREILISCDRTAARVLHDGAAARAADRGEHHRSAERDVHARKQHDRDLRDAAVLDEHRRRFLDSHYRAGHTSLPAHSSETPPKAADGSALNNDEP